MINAEKLDQYPVDQTYIPHILVVDDEIALADSLSEIISDSFPQSKVLTVHSAEDALRTLQEMTIDVLLTDLKLPRRSGLDLLHYVQMTSPATTSILMTAYGNAVVTNEATAVGAVGYIEKPFEVDTVLTYVGFALGRATSHQEEPSLEDPAEKLLKQPHTPHADPSTAMLIRELVALGIDYFQDEELTRAEQCWNQALELDGNCRAATHNLNILKQVRLARSRH